jgi:hypothetical protein
LEDRNEDSPRGDIASADDQRWEHVFVSLPTCPTWEGMSFIKDLLFCDDECVIQVHRPNKDWVNDRRYCMHL